MGLVLLLVLRSSAMARRKRRPFIRQQKKQEHTSMESFKAQLHRSLSQSLSWAHPDRPCPSSLHRHRRLACVQAQRPAVVAPCPWHLMECGAFPLQDGLPPIRAGTLHFLIPRECALGAAHTPASTGTCQPRNSEWGLRTWGWQLPPCGAWAMKLPWPQLKMAWGLTCPPRVLPAPVVPWPTELPGLALPAGQGRSPGFFPRVADA